MSKSSAHDWEDKQSRTSDVLSPNRITFQDMMLRDMTVRGLKHNNYTICSPIQSRAIPLGCSGMDLLVQAKSGTGKTLVFAITILEAYKNVKTQFPTSLVLAPTREIAVQIQSTISRLAIHFEHFRAECFIGGLDISDDRRNIQNCPAVIGTPGRILHLLKNNVLNTSDVQLFVLDEADQLMTDSFRKDVLAIAGRLSPKVQTLAVSATFDAQVERQLQKIMRRPVGVTAKREVPILLGVKQFGYVLPAPVKETKDGDASNGGVHKMNSMQEMYAKVKAMVAIFEKVPFKQCLIFLNSNQRAQSYCNYLSQSGWSTDVMMSKIDQSQRLHTFKRFKNFQCRILVCTDLMARGVDSENVNLVINLDVPNNSTTYLHRIGRAGRFGTCGMAVTLMTDDVELRRMCSLLGALGGNSTYVLKFPMNGDTDATFVWDYDSFDVRDKYFGIDDGSAKRWEDEAMKGIRQRKKNQKKRQRRTSSKNTSDDENIGISDSDSAQTTLEVKSPASPETPPPTPTTVCTTSADTLLSASDEQIDEYAAKMLMSDQLNINNVNADTKSFELDLPSDMFGSEKLDICFGQSATSIAEKAAVDQPTDDAVHEDPTSTIVDVTFGDIDVDNVTTGAVIDTKAVSELEAGTIHVDVPTQRAEHMQSFESMFADSLEPETDAGFDEFLVQRMFGKPTGRNQTISFDGTHASDKIADAQRTKDSSSTQDISQRLFDDVSTIPKSLSPEIPSTLAVTMSLETPSREPQPTSTAASSIACDIAESLHIVADRPKANGVENPDVPQSTESNLSSMEPLSTDKLISMFVDSLAPVDDHDTNLLAMFGQPPINPDVSSKAQRSADHIGKTVFALSAESPEYIPSSRATQQRVANESIETQSAVETAETTPFAVGEMQNEPVKIDLLDNPADVRVVQQDIATRVTTNSDQQLEIQPAVRTKPSPLKWIAVDPVSQAKSFAVGEMQNEPSRIDLLDDRADVGVVQEDIATRDTANSDQQLELDTYRGWQMPAELSIRTKQMWDRCYRKQIHQIQNYMKLTKAFNHAA